MSIVFECTLKVRDYECDTQGIVNNANYQHYYEIARHEFLEQTGCNFEQLHTQGIDPVVVSVFIRYKHSLHGSDKFTCQIESIQKEGLRYIFNQKIIREKDQKLCSTAQIEVACLTNGHLSRTNIFEDILKPYLSEKSKN